MKTNETFIITVNRNSAGTDVVRNYYDANGNNIGSTLEVGNVKIINEQVIRGGISVSKVLLESGDNKLGNVDLTGIKFAIVSNNTGKVRVNGKDYSNGQVVYIGTTDGNGDFTTANNLLPYVKR